MSAAGLGRVLIVDDDVSVRRSLARLLEASRYEIEVFDSAEELLAAGIRGDPSCAILDLCLPGLDGLALQLALARLAPSLSIIFISGHGDIPTSVRAMKAGAVDFLPKPVRAATLLAAVAEGVQRSTVARQREQDVHQARRLLASLTEREAAVFRLVVAGRMNKQIAGELGIAEKTVKLHRGKMTKKLGSSSVAEMVRLADSAGSSGPERDS